MPAFICTAGGLGGGVQGRGLGGGFGGGAEMGRMVTAFICTSGRFLGERVCERGFHQGCRWWRAGGGLGWRRCAFGPRHCLSENTAPATSTFTPPPASPICWQGGAHQDHPDEDAVVFIFTEHAPSQPHQVNTVPPPAHLHHSHEDAHLHLDRVEELQLGAGAVPGGVHAKDKGGAAALQQDVWWGEGWGRKSRLQCCQGLQ